VGTTLPETLVVPVRDRLPTEILALSPDDFILVSAICSFFYMF
jgi:hypothetical protein